MNDYNEAKLLKKIKVMFDETLEIKLDQKLDEKLKNIHPNYTHSTFA